MATPNAELRTISGDLHNRCFDFLYALTEAGDRTTADLFNAPTRAAVQPGSAVEPGVGGGRLVPGRW